MRRVIGMLLFLALAAAPFVYAGCGASTTGVPTGAPAAPGGVPVEAPIPVVLKLLDADQARVPLAGITPDFGGGASISTKALPVNTDVSGIIPTGPAAEYLVYEFFLKPSLNGLNSIDLLAITPDANAQWSGTITFPGTSQDSFLYGTHNVKLDFNSFDHGIAGLTCSGTNNYLPVCLRMWIDGKRHSAWVFTEGQQVDGPATPDVNEESIGTGAFKVFLPASETGALVDLTFAIGFTQTVTPAESKSIESFFRWEHTYSRPCSGFECISDLIRQYDWHGLIVRDGSDASGLKRADIAVFIDSLDQDTSQTSTGFTQYIGQYLEGLDYWSGSVQRVTPTTFSDPKPDLIGPDYLGICARISTALTVDLGMCQDVNGVNIDVDSDPFIRFLEDADLAIPADFPEGAPF